MRIHLSNKVLLIILYVILLIALFGIFALVQNSSKEHSSMLNIIYIVLFLTIIIVSGLFTIAFRYITKLEFKIESEKQIVVVEDSAKIDIQENTADNVETEYNVDFKTILPKEKTKIEIFSEELLKNIASEFDIVQGLVYIKSPNEEIYKCTGLYAYYSENKPAEFKAGETLPGQAAKSKTVISISNIPDQYMTIVSGLGKTTPRNLTFVPIKNKEDVVGIIEFATFSQITEPMQKALNQLSEKIGEAIVKLFKK